MLYIAAWYFSNFHDELKQVQFNLLLLFLFIIIILFVKCPVFLHFLGVGFFFFF
jgi:hypothetical protein